MRAFLVTQVTRPVVMLLLFCSELAATVTQFVIDDVCQPAALGPTLAFPVRLGSSTLLPVIVVVLLVIAVWDSPVAPSALGELGLGVAGVFLGALQVSLQYEGSTCFVGRYFLVLAWVLAVVAVIKMVRVTWESAARPRLLLLVLGGFLALVLLGISIPLAVWAVLDLFAQVGLAG